MHTDPRSNLMVLETPLLRVSRPVAACQRCRSAKIKCDGKLPACTACEKSNRASECSSTNDQFARGKERSYVATLEARVERLEKKIAEARARRKSSTIVMTDAPTEEPATTPRRLSQDTVKGPRPGSQRAERRKEASDIDELVSDFGLLAVNATARDFYGFTTEMSYARLILSASSKEPMPADLTKALPPKFAATPLISHYVNTLYALLPIFEETTLYGCVDAVYHLDGIGKPFDFWVVRMVLAIACLLRSDQRGDTWYSDAVGHANAALEHAEKVLHPGFITSIQALVLLVIYATMDPHHYDSWTLIGAASRAMVDLGIHQDPSRSVSMAKSKLEIRRRVYWCVYSLDRSTSLVQTRAFSFSDDSAHVHLPFHNASSSSRHSSPQSHVFLQSFDSALDMFRIRQIQSEWYMDLFQSGRDQWQDPYPYIWNMYNRMSEWFNDMSQSTLPALRSFFELELLYSYVYILSPSSRVPHIHEYAQRLIFEHCIAYATNLLANIDNQSITTRTPVTFYDAMRAYMTGRQFVDILSRNLDVILDPRQPSPPAPSAPSSTSDDPLAPAATVQPPPFPTPLLPEGHSIPQDPTTRAINAINDFTTILSRFGLRFGFTHWRDRFQRESGAVLAQLYQRSSLSPHASPQAHHTPVQPAYAAQSWIPLPSPSQQQPSQMYSHALPQTPPSAYSQQQQQHNPFSPSPYDNNGSGSHYAPPPSSSSSTGQVPDWTTTPPSAHSLPDLPPPSGGRVRQALVYGPGIPQHQGSSPVRQPHHVSNGGSGGQDGGQGWA
ncbi:Zn(II)2Cys6 cluster transcripitional activator [Periconia macrospinosa]|uniref:Zn(II)2Cys6 cluster transcripitional activator n=1 Tax=Periconia macrospinosa TaxID=97972 RepID=A0A2V1DRN3_9PLEO|nr:Zn(II)2Cys6 cluster transcripitional activator [Periconia macrospinosa]